MTDKISFAVDGITEVALKFEQFPADCHDALLTSINGLTDQLAARIRSAAPSKTGKLRSEITDHVYDDKDHISGRVTIWGRSADDYAKAGALEYGSHRIIQAHDPHASLLKRFFAPLTKMQTTYERMTNIEATNFLRGPLADMDKEIVSELQDAVASVVAEQEGN